MELEDRPDTGREDMVDRVARAIAPASAFDFETDWAMARTHSAMRAQRTRYRRLARAAIEAMREPTQAMKDEIHLMSEGSLMTVGAEYRAMIDAALSPAQRSSIPNHPEGGK